VFADEVEPWCVVLGSDYQRFYRHLGFSSPVQNAIPLDLLRVA